MFPRILRKAPGHPLKTLKETCIQCVSKHLPYYRSADLQSYPSLAEDLINFITDNSIEISDGDRIRLLLPSVKHLNSNWLRSCKNFTRIISDRCPNLTHLTVWFGTSENPNQLLNLVRFIPNVVVLEISACCINDDMLEAIGDSCPALESLCLGLAMNITDIGVRRFCTSKSGGLKLKKLFVERMDEKGCLTALGYLKSLRVLKCQGLEKSISKLFERFKVTGYFSPLKLTELKCAYEGHSSGLIHFILVLCPDLTRLELSFKRLNFNDMDLSNLKRFTKLVTLKLSIDDLMCTPILTDMIGPKLTELTVCFIENLQLSVLGRYCPNLKMLSLKGVSCDPELVVNVGGEELFINLRELFVELVGGANNFRNEHLLFLLKNCTGLRKLGLSSVNYLNDGTFKTILSRVNPLKRLIDLALERCDNFSWEMVMMMLRSRKNFERLFISSCKMITYMHALMMKNFVEKNGYQNLTIIYREYKH